MPAGGGHRVGELRLDVQSRIERLSKRIVVLEPNRCLGTDGRRKLSLEPLILRSMTAVTLRLQA